MPRDGDARPRCGAAYFRGHGLGNDYLVFRGGDAWVADPASVIAICDRHRGVGSDGIVVVVRSDDGVYRLRGFNPDGSEFERSGNGLRVFAAAMADSGEVASERFEAELGGTRVWLRVEGPAPGGGTTIAAGMGRAGFEPADVGLDPAFPDPGGRFPFDPDQPLRARVVSVGNPHCVLLDRELTDEKLERWGPRITSHPAFAGGTNVQLMQVSGPRAIRILIWERGVGRTSASGTSACASAAAAVAEGLCEPGPVAVEMEGGEFEVEVGDDFDLVLRGPIESVCRGTVSDEFLGRLRAGT